MLILHGLPAVITNNLIIGLGSKPQRMVFWALMILEVCISYVAITTRIELTNSAGDMWPRKIVMANVASCVVVVRGFELDAWMSVGAVALD